MMKPFKSFLAIIIFLTCLELFLRLGGFLFLQFQDYQNRKTITTGHVYTIMCVGDSNTIMGGENSYPSQLQKILDARLGKNRFRVINQGLAAASSSIILDSFDSFLDNHHPDMVVVMMGANDRQDLRGVEKRNPVASLRLYKLFKGIGKNIKEYVEMRLPFLKNPAVAATSPFKPVPEPYVTMLMRGLEAKEAGYCDIAEEFFIPLLGVPGLEITFQQRVATDLSRCYFSQKKYEKLTVTLKFLFEIWDYDVSATDMVRELYKQKVAKNELIAMLTQLVEMKPSSVALNGLLGAVYAQFGDNEKAQEYLDKVKTMRMQGNIEISEKNYRKLHQILRARNIKGVYVQYPLRDVNDLKRLLLKEDDFKNMVFVDNAESFQEALTPGGYNKYFTDRGFDDIGHCTPLGNHLLAGNVADAILRYLHKEKG